jgi:Cys-tRNA(Pro)/Cys-tRNA(Cys) deacylase
MKPTNITRLLDSRKIKYTVFELPPEKLGTQETARLLDVPIDTVYKSIVLIRKGRGKTILAVIPGNLEVNLKIVAQVLGEKKVAKATERDAERLTGLQTGGISPLALINRGFQAVIHSSARALDKIHISGGKRGLNIQLSPLAIATLTKASFADICTPFPE